MTKGTAVQETVTNDPRETRAAAGVSLKWDRSATKITLYQQIYTLYFMYIHVYSLHFFLLSLATMLIFLFCFVF